MLNLEIIKSYRSNTFILTISEPELKTNLISFFDTFTEFMKERKTYQAVIPSGDAILEFTFKNKIIVAVYNDFPYEITFEFDTLIELDDFREKLIQFANETNLIDLTYKSE